jgi:hypothetical protein
MQNKHQQVVLEAISSKSEDTRRQTDVDPSVCSVD